MKSDRPSMGIHKVGKGRIVRGISLAELFRQDHLRPDCFTGGPGANGTKIGYIHRRVGADVDIYFVANHLSEPAIVEQHFRSTQGLPELWDPNSGEMRILSEFRVAGGQTIVPLKFAPAQSFFIIFRKDLPRHLVRQANFPDQKLVQQLTGPWDVSFDPKWGAPRQVAFDPLQDWSKHAIDGIKHYSGVGVYKKDFELPSASAGKKFYLDLGKVKNLARVRLNGKDLGSVWTAPWQVEITNAIRPGANRLEIEVANLWMNRLIGDAALPLPQRLTRTSFGVSAAEPLTESGLLGPVRVMEK